VPAKAGKYNNEYVIAFTNEDNVEEVIYKFGVSYEVQEKEFTSDQLAKAKLLEELFPGKEGKFYCNYVKICGNSTMEDMIEGFLAKAD